MNKKISVPRTYRCRSISFFNGSFFNNGNTEVFVPLNSREEDFFFSAVEEAERKHNRILTEKEIERIAELTKKHCEFTR